MSTGLERCSRLAIVVALTLATCLALGARAGSAEDDSDTDRGGGHFCSRTASLAQAACRNQVQDDYLIAKAICINISEAEERRECFQEAMEAKNEDGELCRDQHTARREVCEAIGEGRYDPDFDPEDFVTAFEDQNPYLPLRVGNQWSYEGDAEVIEVLVLEETKLIEGVTCIVVNDKVWEDEELVEDTDDWEAQAANGDVWYCGEEAKDYETFEGDTTVLPELVSIDGSFKAGRDGDKAGLLFPRHPQPGQAYRQEFSLGNAEDVAEVLTKTFACDGSSEFDEFVSSSSPSLTAFCKEACEGGDCVVVKEWSPLDPGVFEWKYFARGIGMFLEANLETGDTVQLAECNVSPLCSSLP